MRFILLQEAPFRAGVAGRAFSVLAARYFFQLINLSPHPLIHFFNCPSSPLLNAQLGNCHLGMKRPGYREN